MSLWAVVPVKPFEQGKSRLAGVLTEAERYDLNASLFNNTIRSILAVELVSQVLVVSNDRTVLAAATAFGAQTVQEKNVSNLNSALRLAAQYAVLNGATRLLVMPADIPLLNGGEIIKIISLGIYPRQLVITPDRNQDGTNALLVSPATGLSFEYGPGSFQKHIAQAEKKGMRVEVYFSNTLGLDLDFPEDLEILRQFETKKIGSEEE